MFTLTCLAVYIIYLESSLVLSVLGMILGLTCISFLLVYLFTLCRFRFRSEFTLQHTTHILLLFFRDLR